MLYIYAHSSFFFSSRRRHTRSDRDWSSDVCSSDLQLALRALDLVRAAAARQPRLREVVHGGRARVRPLGPDPRRMRRETRRAPGSPGRAERRGVWGAISGPPMFSDEEDTMATVTVHGGASGLAQEVLVGPHRAVSDEPVADGGADTGPSPYDYLLIALGA